MRYDKSWPGFPLVLDDECESSEPAQSFLWAWLIQPHIKPTSWSHYGRALYDFLGFVNANNLDWRSHKEGTLPAIGAYRDWCKGTVHLADSTINDRLGVIITFYRWAKDQGLIDRLPFGFRSIPSGRPTGHRDDPAAHSVEYVESPDVLLRRSKREIKFLTQTQVKVCYAQLPNPTHCMMFKLMVRTGLRQVECRTFPERYLFDPSKRAYVNPKRPIRIRLNPRDMTIKGDAPREIDLSVQFMQELWDYSVRRRQIREYGQRDCVVYPNLFLTESGEPFSSNAITSIFSALAKRVGFEVRAHMLRHTYATYLLKTLQESKTFKGVPIAYVQKRLGHASISSTLIYLHLLNDLDGVLMLAFENELDELLTGEQEIQYVEKEEV